MSLAQSPLESTFDTKLDLLIDPGTFLARSTTVWSPGVGMGEIQNQAYGYLFPVGPVFWIGHALGVPAWAVERLWSAGLTMLAFDGTRRVARAWGGLGARAALLAGFAFIAAPRFVTTIGTLTGEVLPTTLLPWAVLPLVLARHRKLAPLAAVGLSGIAVLCMGGLNAVETAATLPFPAVVVLSGAIAGELPWKAVGAWAAAVGAACLWWVGPLVVLGRYSPPFLDYIESAANTTSPVGWTNAVRGTDHWLALVSLGSHRWWEAGFNLATQPALIFATAIVAAMSLAGLARRDIPNRSNLLIPLSIGLICLVAAHGTVSGGLFTAQVRSLLDGALAPLRNIHKVDPLVRLPLALGFAYCCRDLMRASPRAIFGQIGRSVRVPTSAVRIGSVAVLLLAVQPAFAGDLRFNPGWKTLPTSWTEAGRFINGLPNESKVLVAPGSGFGLQVWGYTVDEPLQSLTTTPWVVRGQAPLAPGGDPRYLDTIETVLSAGRRSPVLAPLLRRVGITDVLVRSDLDPATTDAPDPRLVDAAISQSPGFTLVRSFGVPPKSTAPIELWAVSKPGATDSRASLVSADNVTVVQGGPENVASLIDAGLLDAAEPTMLASDARGKLVQEMTDGLQRRERDFGRVHESNSAVMAANDPFREARSRHDFETSAGLNDQTVAWSPALRTLTATTSAGYADVLGPVEPEHAPAAAIDGLTSTDWRSAPFSSPVGQMVAMSFEKPTTVPTVTVAVSQLPNRPVIRVLQLTTDRGEYVAPVDMATGAVSFALPDRPITSLSIRVIDVDHARDGDREIGISEITLPGVDLTRYLVLPGIATAKTDIAMSAVPPTRACVLRVGCNGEWLRTSEDAAGIFRVYSSSASGRWKISARAVAVPSLQTLSLVAPPANKLRIIGSSVFGTDPTVAPIFGFDGDPRTRWLAAAGDTAPTLTLEWSKAREFSQISIAKNNPRDAVTDQRDASEVILEAGGHRRTVSVSNGRITRFAPLRGKDLRMTFLSSSPGFGPMSIPEITIPGLNALKFAPNPRTRTGEPCGFGPDIQIDGHVLHTRVTGDLGDVLNAQPLSVIPCGLDYRTILKGEHRIQIRSTARFQPISAELNELNRGATRLAPESRTMHITQWSASKRRVAVGPGATSILWVKENENSGWVAKMNGQTLRPLTIDGWQQGWRVPAGAAGNIILSYAPQRAFTASLLVGAGGATLLATLTALALLRRRRFDPALGARRTIRLGSRALAWEGLIAMAMVGGAGVLIGAVLAAVPRLRGLAWRRGIVMACGVFAAGLTIHGDGRSDLADLLMASGVGIVLSPAPSTPDSEANPPL